MSKIEPCSVVAVPSASVTRVSYVLAALVACVSVLRTRYECSSRTTRQDVRARHLHISAKVLSVAQVRSSQPVLHTPVSLLRTLVLVVRRRRV